MIENYVVSYLVLQMKSNNISIYYIYRMNSKTFYFLPLAGRLMLVLTYCNMITNTDEEERTDKGVQGLRRRARREAHHDLPVCRKFSELAAGESSSRQDVVMWAFALWCFQVFVSWHSHACIGKLRALTLKLIEVQVRWVFPLKEISCA